MRTRRSSTGSTSPAGSSIRRWHTQFRSGKPPFGIIVARADGGVARSGWIYDCLTGRFCTAHLGSGAFIDGERIVARPTGKSPPVAALSLIFMQETRREATRRHISPAYDLVDIPYCAAEQYPRLALGENDVSIFERTLAWDHAAGVLWLNEAGGKAARPDGSPYRVDEVGRTGLLGAASPPCGTSWPIYMRGSIRARLRATA